MLRRSSLAAVAAIVAALVASPTTGWAECCKCTSCPTSPTGSGTYRTCQIGCHADKQCTGNNCAHGGCENIEGCTGGNVSSIPHRGGSMRDLMLLGGLEWLATVPPSLHVAGRLNVDSEIRSLVVVEDCGAVRGIVPLSLASSMRLARVLPEAFPVGPRRVPGWVGRDAPTPHVLLVTSR